MRALGKISWILIGFYLLLVVLNAWMSDDIYISFRSIYNFTHGYGLRWNITERVQVFTHPLWVILLVPFYWISHHAFLTVMGISVALSAATAYLLVKHAATPKLAHAALLLLISSKAFIDYSTSGLENPLAHFLMIFLFIQMDRWRRQEEVSTWLLGLLGGLLVMVRLDFAVLLLPIFVWVIAQRSHWANFKGLLLGSIPFVLWEFFSLVYYGSFVPNTFYAKAQTGLPATSMLMQGAYYFLDSLQNDWPTLLCISGAILLCFRKSNWLYKCWAIGLLFYLFYIASVGGDFMSGRFFSVPFIVAVMLVSQLQLPEKVVFRASLLVFLLSLFQTYHPLHTRPSYYDDRKGNERALYPHGIVDEKGIAWERSGFLDLRFWDPVFKIEQQVKQEACANPSDTIEDWQVQVAIGMRGYQAGPKIYIVDQLALSDPLLARLPAERRDNLRVGHYFRKLPEGYLESLKSGTDQFTDRPLATYYEKIQLITQGELWSKERWNAIYELNTGQLDKLINTSYYEQPPEVYPH